MMQELTDLETQQVYFISEENIRAVVACRAQGYVIEYTMARILVLMALSHTHGDRKAAAKFVRETFDLMKFLTKEQKTEIRDQVELRLRARSLPIPACFDVVWDTTAQIVYIASTQSKLTELFEELFTHTFGLHLEPLTPYFLALNALGANRQEELDALEPTIFALGGE